MRRVLLSTLLGLGLAALVLAAPGVAQSPDPPMLVRVDLARPGDLVRVDAPTFGVAGKPIRIPFVPFPITKSRWRCIRRSELCLSTRFS